MTASAPPPQVLAAFGAAGDAVPLAGGQGRSWRAGGLVLKPLDSSPETLDWLAAEVAPRVRDAAIRVSLPLRSGDGALVVDGWTAAPYLPGRHESGRWREVAAVGEEFAALLADVARPAFLDTRDDAWARADALAWGEASDDAAALVPHVADLTAARRPVPSGDAPSIVHGDLSGNVLFADTLAEPLPPALLDLSLYWRPPAYASAVVAVDAVCWHREPVDLLTELGAAPQHLVRALLFRLLADHLNGRPAGDPGYASYGPCAARVLELARPDL
ncbi:aminoglycoside phosphotransferase [Beutenbergia cavernae DSM 12333]|uniref:Aminoglycoside phosphotransferase n=1 Tax=Beutenbergia cavernae (strain ATCC BAA-8 / DSM 12333 / CCUG 43141 / JCM 11478 / NBRC 16432 / NCIMB 13614 / HKI 0122) TaxID=471853 RepID=C5C4E4_BEUC1|nr:aminoglycoside phosphotransferase [Beutenbergia cavernae]ACQ82068.1 aminoglycoside phosphotransferase [Beutenbergia cavernae DSM 12333]